jgi:cell division protein FtsI/penicillin-binding protein 2
MGRSLNTVFGRLGSRYLDAAVLAKIADSYGFGKPVPFDIPVQPSTLQIPDGDLEFARTCAGFWNSTLSPVHGVVMMALIAQDGAMMQPVLVNSVTDHDGEVIYRAPAAPRKIRQAIPPTTAAALREMLGTTVSDGTAYKQFHDQRGRSFLPNIKVASKTGTLTDPRTQKFYTWLVGFAPADKPEVAFASLVTNGANWHTRGPLLAREMLRAYFASRGTPGITPP